MSLDPALNRAHRLLKEATRYGLSWIAASGAPGEGQGRRYSGGETAALTDQGYGAGAKAPGNALVYASETQALACLETVVHLNAGGLPLNRYLVGVTIPDAAWGAARTEGGW